MKIYDNENLYQRYTRYGLFANIGGMVLLVLAVFVLFNSPGRLGQYFLFLLAGIILVQIGLTFGRWGKRADLALNKALKSLDNNYSIYHQRSPAQHLLVGPTGMWILLPRHTQGRINYNKAKQRWEHKGNIFQRLWRWVTQERLGRPHFEAMIEAGKLDQFLESRWDEEAGKDINVHAAVVFLNDEVDIQAGEAPFPAVQAKKLKQTISKGEEGKKLSKGTLKKLNQILQS